MSEQYAAFNTALEVLLNTLLLRIQSAQTKSDLRTARNYVEVANTLAPGTPLQKFRAHCIKLPLINAVRRRDVHALLDEVRKMAADGGKDEILSALGNVTEEDIGANFPWKSFCAVCKAGAPEINIDEVSPRVFNFNAAYNDFLQNMIVAFPPGDEGWQLLEQFDEACMNDAAKIYNEFKQVCEPYLENLKEHMTGEKKLDIFTSPDSVFNHLPLLHLLPLQQYWKVQITDNAENVQMIGQMFMQLLITMVGLPGEIFGGDLITNLQQLVAQEVGKANIDNAVDENGKPRMDQVMGIAMNIFNQLQNTGQLDEMVAGIGELDLDEEMLKRISENADLPPEIAGLLDVNSGVDAPIFGGSEQK